MLLGLEQQLGLQGSNVEHGEEVDLLPETRTALLFTALQVGKENGLIQEIGQCSRLPTRSALTSTPESTASSTIEIRNNIICIPDLVLGRLLNSESIITRLAGLSLLVTSTQSTRSFTLGTLQCIKQSLPHLLADTDSHFRGEVQSFLKAVLDRMRASTFFMVRGNGRNVGTSESTALASHQEFIVWLHGFLITELSPTASYQRHISAVKGLHHLLRSGIDPSVSSDVLSRLAQNSSQWPFNITIINDIVRRLLSDMLLDPFEDVRQGALDILKLDASSRQHTDQDTKKPSCVTHSSPTSILEHGHADSYAQESLTFDRARAIMLRTGRVDHADGVARLYDLRSFRNSQKHRTTIVGDVQSFSGQDPRLVLIEELTASLERSIEAAKINISNAVSNFPLHGLFTTLR